MGAYITVYDYYFNTMFDSEQILMDSRSLGTFITWVTFIFVMPNTYFWSLVASDLYWPTSTLAV